MQNSLTKIPEKYRLVINSVLPLFIVIILFVVVGQFGISKVVELGNQITKAEKDQTVLTQKIQLLESISQTISSDSGVSVSALPEANPSLITVSQIKNQSIVDAVLISGIKAGNPVADAGGISHVSVSFETTGTRPQIIAFLKNLARIAPIIIIDKVKISESAGIARADVTIRSYWADLPKSLPTLTSPITDLTAAEKKILTDLTGLTQPIFVTVPASTGGGKTNPFGEE